MGTPRWPEPSATFRKISLPGISPVESKREKLRINVVFSGFEATEFALKRAVDLAIDLEAETRIIVPHLVPFPLPLEEPPVQLDFMCHQIRLLAGSAGADPYVDLYLCRDPRDLLLKVLPPASIVVIGARKRWFPTKADGLARLLRKNGFDVLLSSYG